MSEPLSTSRDFERLRVIGVPAVAISLGFDLRGKGLAPSVSPCPSCGRTSRGKHDHRGPVGLTANHLGWHCHVCNCGGDAPAFAAQAIMGSCHPGDWRPVLERVREVGLLEPRLPPEIVATNAAGPGHPVRPNPREIDDVLDQLVDVTSDQEASAWVVQRGLPLDVIVDRGLLRVIRSNACLPPWARYRGVPWTESGHRLLVPMIGPTGKTESVHTRNLHAVDPKGRDKSGSPAGYQIGGLVMADALGQRLLQDGRCPKSWARPRIIVAEGVPDFLTWASLYSQTDPEAPAVMGIIAGSWSIEIAPRIPRECTVLVQTHADDAGRKYARKIAESLYGRCAEVYVPEGTVIEVEGGIHA